LAERVGSREHLEREVAAWEAARNAASIAASIKVQWRFTRPLAKVYLLRLSSS
jgi:hypothetical protein